MRGSILLRNPKPRVRAVKNLAIAILLLALTCSLPANAAITEIRADYPSPGGNGPYTFVAPPAVNATYIVSAYATSFSNCFHPQFQWTDENGLPQSANGLQAVMHVQAGSTPVLNFLVIGPYPCGKEPYSGSVFITGFGLWPNGTEAQGGLSEPISINKPGLTSLITNQVLLTPAATGTYLLSANITRTKAGESLYSTLSWTDELGPQSAPLFAGDLLSVHSLGGFPIALSTVLNFGTLKSYDLHVRGIYFGTPSPGSGPLSDTELNLPNWSNATYPAVETVVSVPATAEYIYTSTIALAPGWCKGGSESVALYFDGAQYGVWSALDEGAPAWRLGESRLLGTTGFRFFTMNHGCGSELWGVGPTYSLESAAIRF